MVEASITTNHPSYFFLLAPSVTGQINTTLPSFNAPQATKQPSRCPKFCEFQSAWKLSLKKFVGLLLGALPLQAPLTNFCPRILICFFGLERWATSCHSPRSNAPQEPHVTGCHLRCWVLGLYSCGQKNRALHQRGCAFNLINLEH